MPEHTLADYLRRRREGKRGEPAGVPPAPQAAPAPSPTAIAVREPLRPTTFRGQDVSGFKRFRLSDVAPELEQPTSFTELLRRQHTDVPSPVQDFLIRKAEQFQRRVIEPAAAVVTTGFQQFIPGQQEIETKFKQLRAQGVGPIEAARRAYLLSDLPPGVKGLIEITVDPLNLIPGLGFTGKPLSALSRATTRRAIAGPAARGLESALVHSGREVAEETAEVIARQPGSPKLTPIEVLADNTPAPPPRPPRPPDNVPVDMPAMEPPSGRPRTINDMIREAKGQRALTPEERAGISDALRPIDEGGLLYKIDDDFERHARDLLQPDTPIRRALRGVPGVKQVVALWTPAQMERTNPIAMIGLRKDMFLETEMLHARTAVMRWQLDADRFFRFRKSGSLLARIVRPNIDQPVVATRVQAAEGVSTRAKSFGTIDDMLENPQNYILTSQQQAVIKQGQDMTTQLLRDAQRLGVDAVEMTEAYWHRIVTAGPSETLSGTMITKRVGARKGHTLQRAFKDVEEGIEEGYRYETDPGIRLLARLEAGIQTIADAHVRRQISRLPGVETALQQLERRFPATIKGVKQARVARDNAKAAFLKKGGDTPDNLMKLRQSEADFVSAQRDLYIDKRQVGQASWGESRLPNGRFAPRELVAEVDKYLDLPGTQVAQGGKAMQLVVETMQAIRTNLTTADLAAGFIQGQALFFRPAGHLAWWKAQLHSLISVIDSPKAYVDRNAAVIDEAVDIGAISIPTDFLYARRGLASAPTAIPLAGPALKGLNRAFEWFIFVAQTELYKATRTGAIKKAPGRAARAGVSVEQQLTEDLVSLGTAIRKGVGTESFAILGVRPTQKTIESLMLFAPRFTRAFSGLLAQSLTGGPGGAEARKAVGSLLAGGTSLLVGIHYLRHNKMPNVDDPFAPDWMQTPQGRSYFNPYGPFYNYFRTLARMSVYISRGEPDKATKEMANFVRSKASVALRGADIAGSLLFRGEAQTFEGERMTDITSTVTGIAKEFGVPIAPGELIQGLQEGRPEAAVELIGINPRATQYSQMDIEFQRQEDINPDGKSFRYAIPSEKQEMARRFPDIAQKMIERGRGKSGQARREWDQADKDAYGMEEGLIQELQDNEITLDEFRGRYSEIQREKAVDKAATNHRLGLFQDKQDLPDDPNDRALAQYYQSFDEARTSSGRLDYDVLEEIEAKLREDWTPEQEEYVDLNTGLTDHPALIQEFLEDREKVRPYLDIGRKAADLFRLKSLYRKYRVSEDKPRFQGQHPEMDTLFTFIEEEKERFRTQEDPSFERILYKWGYIDAPSHPDLASQVEVLRSLQGGVVTNRLEIDAVAERLAGVPAR